MRDPFTPDCSVDGCTRASWRLGLCRKHRPLVPDSLADGLMLECINASRRLRRKYEKRAAAIANGGGVV